MDGTIITRLKDRMFIGKERYGHGVRPGDNTKKWGTKNNDWFEMAEEELLDAIMYVCADYKRTMGYTTEVTIKDLECKRSTHHQEIINTLEKLILITQRRSRPRSI